MLLATMLAISLVKTPSRAVYRRMQRDIDVALPGRNWQRLWMIAGALTAAAAKAIHG